MSGFSIACTGCGLEYDWSPEYAGYQYPCECGAELVFPESDPNAIDVPFPSKFDSDEIPAFTKPTGTVLDDEMVITFPRWMEKLVLAIGLISIPITLVVGLNTESTFVQIQIILWGLVIGVSLAIIGFVMLQKEAEVGCRLTVDGLDVKPYGMIRWVDIEEARAVFLILTRLKGTYIAISIRHDSTKLNKFKRRGGEEIHTYNLKSQAAKAAGIRCEVLLFWLYGDADNIAFQITHRAQVARARIERQSSS